MKVEDVPQDEVCPLRRALYAVDRDGHYTMAESSGWQVEKVATRVALEDFEHDAAAAYQRCLNGEAATLEYHMYARRMDVATLADASGTAKWRVRRHLHPDVFARLSQRRLARYAQALHMPVAAMQQLPSTDPPGADTP